MSQLEAEAVSPLANGKKYGKFQTVDKQNFPSLFLALGCMIYDGGALSSRFPS